MHGQFQAQFMTEKKKRFYPAERIHHVVCYNMYEHCYFVYKYDVSIYLCNVKIIPIMATIDNCQLVTSLTCTQASVWSMFERTVRCLGFGRAVVFKALHTV